MVFMLMIRVGMAFEDEPQVKYNTKLMKENQEFLFSFLFAVIFVPPKVVHLMLY